MSKEVRYVDKALSDFVAKQVYFKRRDLHYTQAECAKELGISQQTYCLIENRKRQLTIVQFNAFVGFLECHKQHLLAPMDYMEQQRMHMQEKRTKYDDLVRKMFALEQELKEG